MPQDTELLLFAAAVVAAAAALLAAFALTRRSYPGLRHWFGACAGVALGLLAAATWPGAAGTAVASVLLLQWPLVALLGLRRFHARHRWPLGPRTDRAVLTLAALAAGAGAFAPAPLGPALLGAAVLVTHLGVAGVILLGPPGRETLPLLGLGGLIALAALLPALWTLLSQPPAALPGSAGTALLPQALAASLGALGLAFFATLLCVDRTERQLRESRRRLRALANLDALTQVPNRRHFDELAQAALRIDPPGSAVLLLFDVDHFKRINDELGHAAGDRALCLVAACVTEHLRAPDVGGRHGGDEFVLLLRRTDTRAAIGVAARIVCAVQARASEAGLPPLTLSFGLVQVGACEPLATALRRADQALYEAKRQGRSRAVAALGDEAQPVFSESQRLGLLAA